MNAAARVISQGSVFHGRLGEMKLSREFITMLVLMGAIFLSALSVILVTNDYRMEFSQLQQLEQQKHQLELQWGQLLLEQASLATPSRVEKIASESLGMHLPADNKIMILKAR